MLRAVPPTFLRNSSTATTTHSSIKAELAQPRRTPKQSGSSRRLGRGSRDRRFKSDTNDGIMEGSEPLWDVITQLSRPSRELSRFDVVYLESVVGEGEQEEIGIGGVKG